MNELVAHLRYSTSARIRDFALAFGLSVVPGMAAASMIPGAGCLHVVAAWVGCSAVPILVLGLWRWSRKGFLDRHGAAIQSARGGPVRSLAWEEVDEIFPAGKAGVEFRGRGIRMRFSDDFEPLGVAWAVAGRRRGRALRDELKRRLDAGETLRFRGPWGVGAAGLTAALVAGFFFPLLSVGPAALLQGPPPGSRAHEAWVLRSAMGLMFSALMAVVLGLVLARIVRTCGWVELGPEGLSVRETFRVRRIPWTAIRRIENQEGRVHLFREVGPPRVLLPGLGNSIFLEELIRSRTGR